MQRDPKNTSTGKSSANSSRCRNVTRDGAANPEQAELDHAQASETSTGGSQRYRALRPKIADAVPQGNGLQERAQAYHQNPPPAMHESQQPLPPSHQQAHPPATQPQQHPPQLPAMPQQHPPQLPPHPLYQQTSDIRYSLQGPGRDDRASFVAPQHSVPGPPGLMQPGGAIPPGPFMYAATGAPAFVLPPVHTSRSASRAGSERMPPPSALISGATGSELTSASRSSSKRKALADEEEDDEEKGEDYGLSGVTTAGLLEDERLLVQWALRLSVSAF